jgi:hypothetical protein
MITNEQVEAALKAWYDAGDAGNFASMFAALKAADLEAAARIAELEAENKRLGILHENYKAAVARAAYLGEKNG